MTKIEKNWKSRIQEPSKAEVEAFVGGNISNKEEGNFRTVRTLELKEMMKSLMPESFMVMLRDLMILMITMTLMMMMKMKMMNLMLCDLMMSAKIMKESMIMVSIQANTLQPYAVSAI